MPPDSNFGCKQLGTESAHVQKAAPWGHLGPVSSVPAERAESQGLITASPQTLCAHSLTLQDWRSPKRVHDFVDDHPNNYLCGLGVGVERGNW